MNYDEMIYIMIPSGILSSMSIWADKIGDVRISINEIYMILLMTLWMIFFMSIIHKNYILSSVIIILIIIVLILIRGQYLVKRKSFYTSMIPHHSMAVMMSKRLLENDESLSRNEIEFLKKIIKTQEEEIEWMKRNIKYS
jgi:hypothetical protein